MLTRDGYYPREIKMRIAIAKEALAEVRDIKIGGRIINKVRFADNTAIIAKPQEELQDMVNRLVDTGKKYGMEINIGKSTSNESIQE